MQAIHPVSCIEISTRKWHDGDLISWAYDYELHTHHRKPPVLVEKGLLPIASQLGDQ